MTDRKFTPPTEFPAEYVTSDGRKAVISGIGPRKEHAFVGYFFYANDLIAATFWEEDGYNINAELHDLPKKQVHWANDYGGTPSYWDTSRKNADAHVHLGRIAVIRREWVEGQLPQYFVEEV